MSGKVYARRDQGGISDSFEAMQPGTSQTVAIGSGSVQSNAFAQTTTIIRAFGTVDCYLAFGANPSVTPSTAYFLPGGIVDFIGVDGSSKVAVANSSAIGSLFISEGS